MYYASVVEKATQACFLQWISYELFLDVCRRWCGSLMEEMNKVTLKVHEECGNGEVRSAPLKVVK